MVVMLDEAVAQATKDKADELGMYLSRYVEQVLAEATNNESK